MALLSSILDITRVRRLWIVILVSGLILFINNIEQFCSPTYLLAQDETLLMNISHLIDQADYLSNIGNYSTVIDFFESSRYTT
ncbi:MAG TPA: hypothetical protein VFG45_10505 [Candidatus Nitrosocosmicus sp.]|nr:hypothetical protein [Candidatus Nitrosocosmicus sp.]